MRRQLRIRTLAALTAALAAVALIEPLPAAATTPNYNQIIQDEAYWISTKQLPDSCGNAAGALAWYTWSNGTAQIRPYVANIGATGMLAAGSYYYPMVKAWIGWYFRHLNRPDYNGVSGTVYDYDDNTTTCVEATATNQQGQNPSYDSTDAYAGTFLSLLRQYAQANPSDDSYLQTNAANIKLVADAIIATLQSDGLTYARPDYHAQLLMDNVEAEQGLSDYGWLLSNALGDPADASYYGGKATTIATAVNSVLWNGSHTSGMYGWAADQLDPSWSNWYPDAVAQTWPLRAELGTAGQRNALWAAFNTAWPNWAGDATNPDGSPWCSVGYTAALMGNKTEADAFLNGSQTAWINPGRPWPYTVMDAANRALTAEIAATL